MVQMDIADILGEMQCGPLLASHRKRIGELMRHFAAHAIPIETCADERHLNRSISTLKRYARDFGLQFPDYVPGLAATKATKKQKGSGGGKAKS